MKLIICQRLDCQLPANTHILRNAWQLNLQEVCLLRKSAELRKFQKRKMGMKVSATFF